MIVIKCQVVFLEFSDKLCLFIIVQICLNTVCTFLEIFVLKYKDETVVPTKLYEKSGQSSNGMKIHKVCKDYRLFNQKCVKRHANSYPISRAGLLKEESTDRTDGIFFFEN